MRSGTLLSCHPAALRDGIDRAYLQADSIRDFMREAAPLGAAHTTASVEEATPEEEEEEEGEDEDEGKPHWYQSLLKQFPPAFILPGMKAIWQNMFALQHKCPKVIKGS